MVTLLAAHFGVHVGFVEDDADLTIDSSCWASMIVEVVAIPDCQDACADISGMELIFIVGCGHMHFLELVDGLCAQDEVGVLDGLATGA